ncbi:uncharacterized protein N0V89_009750 [Didymosphaeria variabile]|uniref:F-box domain-containing protein n=1 Tax=Didymosphaeria variabile TaxID=1932322 RepID=A0A9W8XDY0_9PLEO|nr:uncharacterized protein N0V89_009750 [Didymosphaeria variabile]KAJ4348376.1 hypothetical protein N0V89_009750 [Didymosphaeria variabile]
MPLNSLPPELTVTIFELLDPFSCFDFALTCKAHWNLSNILLQKHQRLFAENRVIDARDSAYPYQNHVLWDKLKEILDNPVVGEYVREISLPSSRATYLDGNASHDFQLTAQSARLPQEDFGRYAVAGHQIEELYESANIGLTPNGSTWDEWVSKGSSEPIVVMLVHHMRYLKTFRFTDLEMSAVFMRCLCAIAVSYGASGNPALAPKLPLQHLTTVAVAHWDTEMSCDFDWCIIFCAIPSVRNFITHAMGGDDVGPSLFQPGSLPNSNVRELVFHYSRFGTSALVAILENTPFLERVSYEIASTTVDESVMPTPRQDLKALVEHVGHSLQHLVLEILDYGYEEFEDDLSQVSLRGFQKLKTLRIDWRFLWPVDMVSFSEEEKSDGGFYEEEPNANNDFDPRSLLPASLEKLYLTGSFTKEEKEEVSKIREGPSEFTPLLNNINIRDTSVRFEDEDVPGIHANPLMKYLEGQG